MIKIIEARVSKASNSGVRLYIVVQGTRDEVVGDPAIQVVAEFAAKHGWDVEGPVSMGFPSQYGLTSYRRVFTIDKCSHGYPTGNDPHLADVVWTEGFSGTGPSLLEEVSA